VSGVARPVWPGELSDADRVGLAGLAAGARRGHEWSGVADRLVRLQARGVPVAALSAAWGRAGCGGLPGVWPGSGVGGGPGRRRGVGGHRDGRGGPGRRAGPGAPVCGTGRVGRDRGDGRGGPGAGTRRRCPVVGRPEDRPRTAVQARRDDRAERVHGSVAGGATVRGAAAEVGVDQTSAYQYLQAARERTRPQG